MTIILASGSPRRRELLGLVGVTFVVVPSKIEERARTEGEDPRAYVVDLASQKAEDVAQRCAGEVVLGADTVVVVDGVSLGKPRNKADAVRMLRLLRARAHTVVTGVAVCRDGSLRTGSVSAEVSMRSCSDDDIDRYVETGEPMDKAGAYAIQGVGGAFVESVRGCYNTVVGLPLCLTVELLCECSVGGLPLPTDICTHVG